MFEIPVYQGWDPSVAMSLSQGEIKHNNQVVGEHTSVNKTVGHKQIYRN